ncbi:MAG: metallophosphoesterase family protein [Promethearchaeota archaeon]
MVKYGIIADTHITENDDVNNINALIYELKRVFKDVDQIIHAGDICSKNFLKELNIIAPTISVRGHNDNIKDLDKFIKFSAGKYKIGVIHEQPNDLEVFFKKNELHILIVGHSHQPFIKGTKYNTLLINPGSPTKPKAPPQKRGFDKPIARPSVITLSIDENNLLSTYIINLKLD